MSNMVNREAVKQELLDRLKQEHCFWSYRADTLTDVPDDVLIEKTLRHLDLPEIDSLFTIYSYRQVKQVWLQHLVPQGEYLGTLNRFFAWYYFNAKRPDTYLKAMETRHYNRMMK